MVLSAITEASGASVLFTGDNFTRLLGGLGTSITVAGLALLVGIPLGIILGALRILRNPVLPDQTPHFNGRRKPGFHIHSIPLPVIDSSILADRRYIYKRGAFTRYFTQDF